MIITFYHAFIDTSRPIKVGDKVRVKPAVVIPIYKWGSITHQSIGTVTGMLIIM